MLECILLILVLLSIAKDFLVIYIVTLNKKFLIFRFILFHSKFVGEIVTPNLFALEILDDCSV